MAGCRGCSLACFFSSCFLLGLVCPIVLEISVQYLPCHPVVVGALGLAEGGLCLPILATYWPPWAPGWRW